MTIDLAYRRAQAGDHDGFADWVRRVEIPLRRSLRPFARAIDAESIVQEGLLRMWVLAPTLALEGENASLRYALRLVRNLALAEAKRHGSLEPLDPAALERTEEGAVPPEPPVDEALRAAILACIERIPPKPRAALRARLSGFGLEPDRDLAVRIGMKLNTFLQNVVRARKHLARCLESRGIDFQEIAP